MFKYSACIITLLFVANVDHVFAQSTAIDSLNLKASQLDRTVNQRINSVQDSLNRRLQIRRDRFVNRFDSLTIRTSRVSAFPSDTLQVIQKADSIQQEVTDRLNGVQNAVQDKSGLVKEVSEGVNSNVERINGLSQGKLGSNKLNADLDLTEIGLPQVALPTKSLSWEMPSIDALNLPDIRSKISYDKIPNVSNYLTGMKSLVSGGNEFPENFMSRFNEIGELQKYRSAPSQVDQIMELQTKLAKTQEMDVESVKKQGVLQARNLANEKLSTHSSKIAKAQQSMAKYKKKYASLKSINDLPKFVPNAMKGKPLRERLVPGFFMETKQEEQLGFNPMPRVHYRVTGKFNAGISMNYLVWLDRKDYKLSFDDPVYGVSFFSELHGFKQYFLYSSYGRVSSVAVHPDTNSKSRHWKGQLLTGIGKSYKMGYRAQGRTQLLYHLNGDNERLQDGLRVQAGVSISLKFSPKQKLLNRLERQKRQIKLTSVKSKLL